MHLLVHKKQKWPSKNLDHLLTYLLLTAVSVGTAVKIQHVYLHSDVFFLQLKLRSQIALKQEEVLKEKEKQVETQQRELQELETRATSDSKEVCLHLF